MSTDPRRCESGFGMVEAIIAALLLTIIIASATMMMVGSGTSLRQADVHRMRVEAARSAVQHLSQDQSWGASIPACRDSALPGRPACDISSLVQNQPWLNQGVSKFKEGFRIRATAQGVDSPVDRTGADDLDRRVPDWFELRIVVAGGPGGHSFALDASTDSATRGTGGMVIVRTCAAPEQADERIEPGTCDRAASLSMPPPGGSGPSLDRDLKSFAVSPGWARQVRIEPVSTSCSLQGPSGTVTLRTTSHGSWITPAGLRPGSYGLRCAPPAGYEPWERHTTPAQGVLNVTEGHTSSAFVMFRRAPVEVTVNQGTIHYFRYQVCNDRRCLAPKVRSTFARRFEQYDTKALDVRFQPIPSPYGRLPLPGAVTASAGASVSLHPGLYTNTVLAGSDQYYLYVGERMSTELGVEFGAPISWFYVHPDGTVDSGPADGAGSGLWMVRWYCHEGDSPIQMACPEGRVPEGRGPLRLGGSGGDGAA